MLYLYKLQFFFAPILALIIMQTPAIAAEGAPYSHADEPIGTVREVYDGRLYPDIQVNTFRNIDRLFPTRIVRRGKTVLPLPTRSAYQKQLLP